MRFHPVLFCAAALVLAGCESLSPMLGGMLESAPKPGIRIVDAQVADLSATSLDMVFDVEVENPYPVPLPVIGIDYALDAGESSGEPIFKGDAGSQGSIPANGKKVIQAPVGVQFARLIEAGRGIRPGMVLPYKADLGFKVAPPGGAEPLRLPVSHKGELPVPAVPKVAVDDLTWTKVGLGGTEGALKLKLTNPNEFKVGVEDLKYTLSLAGKPVFEGGIRETVDLESGAAKSFDIPFALRSTDLGLGLVRSIAAGKVDYKLDGGLDIATPFGSFREGFADEGGGD